MPTKDEARERISILVDRFHEHVDEYRKGAYNEHQTRVDYINPFWKALGWDMDNEAGSAEAYRQVLHEDKVKVGGVTKAPDYCFTVNGQKKFYLDAKKPSVKVKTDEAPAFQVRRYGWNAGLPVSIVTDFEEFAVYDTRIRPKKEDKASNARINYYTYQDYLKEFDYFWDTFSWDALLKGKFDKFVVSDKKKRGTATVDEEFLKDIEGWRSDLANVIALRNKKLNEDELSFAVQHIMDRMIFLRICEDRGVEPYGVLKQVTEKGDSYKNLFTLFREADAKYNSGLFDLSADRITEQLEIDNKTIKGIITELYPPWSEYEFSVMPADILGSVYERFLGKTIRLTEAHHAKIDEKPEVRKAGGVYYTPKYVVDYIVENTLGKLLKEKGMTPKKVESLRILDPACGSGSFLIGAYQYLLDWHLAYYTEQFKETSKRPKELTPNGTLSTDKKKRILLNNIYGVDIDAQAVEVTKLNLLLKAMEGETQASIKLMLFHERVLPNLKDNIKCGNSLIGPDFYDNQLDLFAGQMKKINAFDWTQGFPEVFKQGGFDVVIGNPPYVRQELLGDDQKAYFKTHYEVYHGVADLYTYFFEKGISLLNDKGLYGIIVANKWMRANYGEPLRRWLKQQSLFEIIDFGDLSVFQQVTTYPCIMIAGKPNSANKKVRVTDIHTLKFDSLENYVGANHQFLSRKELSDNGWQLVSDAEAKLLSKLGENTTSLGRYVNGKIYYGIKTGLNEAFVIDEARRQQLLDEDPRTAEVLKPFLAGRDIKRYAPPGSIAHLIFFPKGITNQQRDGLLGWNWLSSTYPAIARHLERHKEKAEERYDKGDYWWELRTCDYYDAFEMPKIIIPAIVMRANYSYDTEHFYSNDKTTIIPTDDKFLLGVINSRACDYLLQKIAATRRGGYFEYKPMYVEKLPIPDANNNTRKQISSLVDQLLTLNKQLQTTKLETEREQLQRAIDHAERKIDELVYELYGLTEEEVKIVEGEILSR